MRLVQIDKPDGVVLVRRLCLTCRTSTAMPMGERYYFCPVCEQWFRELTRETQQVSDDLFREAVRITRARGAANDR